MSEALQALKDKYEGFCQERQSLLDTAQERVLNGGEGLTADERTKAAELSSKVDESKEQFEAQRDLEQMVANEEPLKDVERSLSVVGDASGEQNESIRRAVRDGMGSDGLRQFDERSASFLADFDEMSRNNKRDQKLSINPSLCHNLRLLREMGVSAADYVRAVADGRAMVAERNKEGNLDVRVYGTDQAGYGTELVPTFWDNSLYLFASYIGGVQAAGAEVIPVMGNNTLKLPKVTAYASGLDIGAEGTAITTETRDQTNTTDLTPRPYRGFSAETDELMRAAAIDTRMLIVLRGLARALQLGKEDDFHDGDGSSKPKGVLNGVAATRIQKTGGNTTDIRYQDIPGALSKLDAEYFTMGREGSLTCVMHSTEYWNGIVAKTDSDGRPLYPPNWLFGGGRQLFEARVVFSHKMATTPAANALLAMVGNMMDAYVIATMGTMEIEISDDLRFLEWERVYRIQEYCDGQVRDDKALAYVQSAA